MVSHADAPISRVAGGVDHRGGGLLRVDAAGGPQCSVAAPVSVVLRIDHVLQRHGTHADNDPGTYSRSSTGGASGARILFVALSAVRFRVAHHATAREPRNFGRTIR